MSEHKGEAIGYKEGCTEPSFCLYPVLHRASGLCGVLTNKQHVSAVMVDVV